jgi:hypothetical protein
MLYTETIVMLLLESSYWPHALQMHRAVEDPVLALLAYATAPVLLPQQRCPTYVLVHATRVAFPAPTLSSRREGPRLGPALGAHSTPAYMQRKRITT